MTRTSGAVIAATLSVAAVLFVAETPLAQNQTPPGPQNQTPGRPQNQTPARPQNQTPGTPANQTPPGPPPPAAVPLYISPVVVQHIQQQLLTQGFPVPAVNGGWGDNTSAAVALFQQSKGLDPGGDLDELTLTALGLPQVLLGEVPGDAKPLASPGAAGNGAPLSASPQLTRIVQNKLTEAGHPTDNVFGIWLAGSETAARAFQKTKNLDQTGAVDLRLLSTLGLTEALTTPKPGTKSRYDSVAQILVERAVPFTGAPVSISPAGVRQVQMALVQKGQKDVLPDGKWTDQHSAVLKKFQEAQSLEPTGTINLRTLRALGFSRPLSELDQASASPPTRPPS